MALLYLFSLIFLTLALLWQIQKSKWAKQGCWGKGNQLTWTWTTIGPRLLNNVHPLTVAGLDWICPREVNERLSLSCLNIWAIRELVKVEEFCSRSESRPIYYILYSAARGMSLQIGDSHRDDGETTNEPALGRRIFSQVFFNQLEVATYPGQVKKWRS